jgi:lipopolysaccharide transport system ATP-binding protein
MSDAIIKIENLSKEYRLGLVGTGSLHDDLKRAWYRIRGKEDPFLKIGAINNRSTSGNSDYVFALKNIDFEVNKGEVVGIIGKNGAGKSTLLKILSQVTGPTTGEIKLDGRIGALLEVGTGFHPELTGKENIYLNGAILGMSHGEISSKINDIISFSGVKKYIDTPVKRYSSGMKVRLGFAVAAHLEPDILVVDEVLAVGDAEFQKKAIGKMKDVSQGHGRTVLFVSHNMTSIQKLCTRVIVLKDGEVYFDGKTQEGIHKYLVESIELSNKKLADRTDRKGSGELKFTSYRLEDLDGIELKAVNAGMGIKLKLFYESNQILHNLYLTMSIYTEDRNLLFECNNRHSSMPFKEVPVNGYFECFIPKFTLRPGNYYFDISLKRQYDKKIFDSIENVGKLTVEPGDFYGTGSISTGTGALFFVDHKINIYTKS